MIRDYRDKARGLTDLLAYAMMIDEGIILNKDGSLMAGFKYRGYDLFSASNSERELIAAHINRTFCHLGDGWMIHTDMVRSESCDYPHEETCFFPDPTSFLIDEERRHHYGRLGQHFETHLTMVITYRTPTIIDSTLSKLFIEEAHEELGFDKNLIYFKERLGQVESLFSNALLQLTRLKSDELLSHLHQCITGESHLLKRPQFPVYLDTLLGTQDFYGGLYPKIGEKFICGISITGFPLETEPGLLQSLENLPFTFRWSNRFIFLDPKTAAQEIKKYSDKWLQKRQGLKGLMKEFFGSGSQFNAENQDALMMNEDSSDALTEAESTLVRFGFYTSALILMGRDNGLLKDKASIIIKHLESRGFTGRIETINAIEAYMGSLPGHGYQNIRRPLIHTLNLADLIPLSSGWSGLIENPCRYFPPKSPALLTAATNGATPFRLHLHVDDVGHTAIFGGTGKGKSTLVLTLCAQFLRYPKAQIFLFDKGLSSYPLVKALGGTHYDIASSKDSLSFVPLQRIDNEQELNTAQEWLELCMECQGKEVSPLHRKEIRRSLLHLREQTKRSLTHFQSTVQHQDIKDALAPYTLAGHMGHVLDGEISELENTHFHVFEMQEILKKGSAYFLPTIIHIFNEVDRRLKEARPTLLIIEEGHNFLLGRFGAQLETWFAEKRKENVSVIFVDQTLKKLIDSELSGALLTNISTKIFLPNPESDTPINKPYYEALDLSERQIEIIKTAIPKQQYYCVSPIGRRLIDLGLGPFILSFVGSDSANDRKKIDELILRHGDEWVYHWLIGRELSQWAERWLALFRSQKSEN